MLVILNFGCGVATKLKPGWFSLSLFLYSSGLKKVIVSGQNTNVVIPTTSVAGAFEGASASAVRDSLSDRVQQAFKARRFSSEIFLVVGGDWAWGGRTT
jgi:hypothetical protein